MSDSVDIDNLFKETSESKTEVSGETELPRTKSPKTFEIKWKAKLNKGLKAVNIVLERKFSDRLSDQEISMIAEEWEDVLSDVLKRGPLPVKIGISVLITFAIIFGYVERVRRKIARKNKDQGAS
jgi:hypothetical protein